MNETEEFGPAYDLEEKPRTSSNNMLISTIKYVPLNEQEQAEVDELLVVS